MQAAVDNSMEFHHQSGVEKRHRWVYCVAIIPLGSSEINGASADGPTAVVQKLIVIANLMYLDNLIAELTLMPGSTAQYIYDVFNRRIHVQTASGTTEYIYDYAGRRISSWLSPTTTVTRGESTGMGSRSRTDRRIDTTYFDHQDIVVTLQQSTTLVTKEIF
jgi:YD repeat-containing protein